MSPRYRRPVAAGGSAVIAESILGATVIEDGQRDRCLADTSSTGGSGMCQIFYETNNALDQIVAFETRPWLRGRQLSKYARWKFKVLDSNNNGSC